MQNTEISDEAERLMTVCNSCRYCEGLCAVFPAMELRTSFSNDDLNYLANLCHSCGACFDDCQFSPPHEFNVNVPLALARQRAESYRSYVWPAFCVNVFEHNGLFIGLISSLSVAAFLVLFIVTNDPATLFASNSDSGAFYRLIPHNILASIFGAAFLYALLSLGVSIRAFWSQSGIEGGKRIDLTSFVQAMRDAGKLRYLDGGGAGCATDSDQTSDKRRLYHHFTFYGFALCFASTVIATGYHYLAGREAPYDWYELPVVLGTVGGMGLLLGPAGLLIEKFKRPSALQDSNQKGMDIAFIAMLFLVSLTGIALLLFRGTPMMGLLFAFHLGFVFGFFITMPYGKFVHGIYRFASLIRFAHERHSVSAD